MDAVKKILPSFEYRRLLSMKKSLPLIAMVSGFISFIGIIYMMLHPELPSILVFLIYGLATCAGVCGLLLIGKKRER
jgi:hypothetical protein